MRLFIAINFNEELRNKIDGTIEILKDNSVKGSFTKHENLHLTLIFIGESNRLDSVCKAMDMVSEKVFNLTIKGTGRFRRSGGDIYWLGFERNSSLQRIYGELFKALTSSGFQLEDREYKPHLTLGREVTLKDSFDLKSFEKTLPQMYMEVKSIDLMKSERIKGNLIYTLVYEKKLRE